MRAFGLPYVQAGQLLPFFRKRIDALYRSDAALLRQLPSLRYYAGIRVIEVTR
jgi:hypothetical protein